MSYKTKKQTLKFSKKKEEVLNLKILKKEEEVLKVKILKKEEEVFLIFSEKKIMRKLFH